MKIVIESADRTDVTVTEILEPNNSFVVIEQDGHIIALNEYEAKKLVESLMFLLDPNSPYKL